MLKINFSKIRKREFPENPKLLMATISPIRTNNIRYMNTCCENTYEFRHE